MLLIHLIKVFLKHRRILKDETNILWGVAKYVKTAGTENGKKDYFPQLASSYEFSASDFDEFVLILMFILTNLKYLDDSNLGGILLYIQGMPEELYVS